MDIHVRATFRYGNPGHPAANGKFTFSVPVDGTTVNVDVDGQERVLSPSCQAEVTDAFVERLQTASPESWPSQLDDERDRLCGLLHEGARRTIDAIKYYLNRETIDEDFVDIPTVEWSQDGVAWQSLPLKKMVSLSISESLDVKDRIQEIQEYLDRGERPFLALRHLHRAMRESSPRHKWIDATIAAELAAKEFFIRLKPDLEAMLVELPSPSLDKLYGRLLETYAGERSPVRKSLREGMAKRNALVHRPSDDQINLDEANRYVEDVGKAIWHLQSLLHPNDGIIRWHLDHETRRMSGHQTL